MTLATDYRPTLVDEYLGDNVKEFLTSGTLADAKVVFLSGPSGCGKTSAARLIAKQYYFADEDLANPNIQLREQFTQYMKSGDSSELLGVEEIDLTSAGVAKVDEVLADVQVPHWGITRKVYIFDEIHMASSEAQNRLLKPTEELPDGVLFIFATTNAEKVLPTLRTRATYKLQVARPNLSALIELLTKVCRSEGYSFESKGLRQIAKSSQLLIREAFSLLEQTVTTYGDASYDSVRSALGIVDDRLVIDFIRAHSTRNAAKAIRVLGEVRQTSGFGVFLQNLTDFVSRGIYVYNGIQLIDVTLDELPTFQKLFSKYSVSELAEMLAELNQVSTPSTNVESQLLRFVYKRCVVEVDSERVSGTIAESTERSESVQRSEGIKRERAADNVATLSAPTTLLASLSALNPTVVEG